MVTSLRYIKPLLYFLYFFLIIPAIAKADNVSLPLKFAGTYDFSFSGIPFGRINISIEQDEKKYSITSDIKITGIARLFTQHESNTIASGRGKNFDYNHVEYESRYQTKRKQKYAKLIQKNGDFIYEKVEPADNRAIRPEVKKSEKKNAFDPLSLSIAIRQKLADCLKKSCTKFSINYYDGRRLNRVDFAIEEEKIIRIKGRKYPCYSLTAKQNPLAGYTEKELKRAGNNDEILHLYYSHDEKLIPLMLEIPLEIGTVRAILRV